MPPQETIDHQRWRSEALETIDRLTRERDEIEDRIWGAIEGAMHLCGMAKPAARDPDALIRPLYDELMHMGQREADTQREIARLTRERDEALAAMNADVADVVLAKCVAEAERDRLRGLLREVEFDCELAGPGPGCWWCGSTREEGHDHDCRLKAALEE